MNRQAKHTNNDKAAQGRRLPRLFALCAAVLLVSTFLPSCGTDVALPTVAATTPPAVTTPSPTPSPSPTPTPSPSPSPSPTPSPTPTPTPVPTPTPSPTPTPDPWAKHFSTKPVVKITDPKKGPWVYKDKSLSIEIKILYRNHGRDNYVAEIYTRGPLPMNAFADKKHPSVRKLPWYVARVNKAVFGVTADYLTYKDNAKGVMIRNGKVYYDKKANDTLAILPNGEFRIYDKGKVTAKQLIKLGVKDSYSFGPWLVRDGKVNPNLKTAPRHSANSRCSIGMVEPGHYFFVVSRNVTLEQHAQIYIELGCKVAYNLDGGNSSAMVFMGEQINEKIYDPGQKLGQRPLPELIVVGTSKLVPGINDPVKGYNNQNK